MTVLLTGVGRGNQNSFATSKDGDGEALIGFPREGRSKADQRTKT